MATRKSTIKRPSRIEGNLAYIQLTRGYEAVIDADDMPLVAGFNWYALVTGNTVYATRYIRIDGKPRTVLLHRVLLDADDSWFVDHIDRNGLNNCRQNLRLATPAQNQHNQRTNTANRSGYKGVHFHKGGRKWWSQITVNGKRISLGLHDTPESAHAAYCAASSAMHGKFGRTA